MFHTTVVGSDESARGHEAIALAEVLREPRQGTLLLTAAYAPEVRPRDGFVAPEDLRDRTEERLESARDRLPRDVPAHIVSVLSTTAERLLDGARCAVAVAPRGYKGGEIRRVGVAFDGSPEARAALRAAEAIALERAAALSVYCVLEPRQINASVKRDGIDLLFVGSGSVSGALIRDAGCPVIVIPREAVLGRRAPKAAMAARA